MNTSCFVVIPENYAAAVDDPLIHPAVVFRLNPEDCSQQTDATTLSRLPEPRPLTVKDVAAATGLSRSTIYRRIRADRAARQSHHR